MFGLESRLTTYLLLDGKGKKQRLEEIQNGTFAKEWISENMAGRPVFTALRRREAEHPIVAIGDTLRSMMSWLEEK